MFSYKRVNQLHNRDRWCPVINTFGEEIYSRKEVQSDTTPKELCFDELNLDGLKGKTMVGVSPRKGDLIVCIYKARDGIKTFRYRNDQGRKEKYRSICNGFQSSTKSGGHYREGMEIGAERMQPKTLSFEGFRYMKPRKTN